jgi:ABC-type bacteriocin/lantibiotic exporter with double-glycine peptidase domain
MPSFRQRDETDCGAACLAYVLHHYRLDVSLALLRRRIGTNQQGSTALGLVETARAFGLTAKGVRCPPEALSHIELPAIAHVNLTNGSQHYVVLCALDRTAARVMDPACGTLERWSHDQFRAAWSGVLVLLAPGLEFKPGARTKSAFARVCELLLSQKSFLFQAFVGAVATTILSLSTSIYVQKIVDNVIADGNRNLLALLGISMLAILIFRLVLGWFQTRLTLRMSQRIDAALILGYYRHLLRLPQPFFDTMRVGEITSRVGDAVKVRSFLNGALLNLVLQPLILLFALVAMFFYSWTLALLSLGLIPLNLLVYLAADWLNKRYQRLIMERGADFDAQLVESLGAQPVVRAFQLEAAMDLRTETRLVRLLRPVWDASNSGLIVGTVSGFISQAYGIALLWIGATQVLNASLTAGELMSCYTLAGYLTGPITALVGMNAAIRETLVATDRLYEIIDLDLEQDEGQVELTPALLGDIRFEGITFKYPGRLPVLNHLSCTIPAGQITALVGESGCGKSTLLALLQRLHAPDAGRIFIGETDLRYVSLASLRSAIAVVPQQTSLLAGTVLENLTPGEETPDMARVLRVCRETGILEFIESLPNGYRTMLTENGRNLSGGQRQRLAIARALYTEAPILLLDEPSAALDQRSERELLALLLRLRGQGRTIVVSAHTERLLEAADQVLEIRDGRVRLREEAETQSDCRKEGDAA